MCGHEESNLSPNSYHLLPEAYSPAMPKPGAREKSLFYCCCHRCRDDQRVILMAMIYPVIHPSELFEYQLQSPRALKQGAYFRRNAGKNAKLTGPAGGAQ